MTAALSAARWNTALISAQLVDACGDGSAVCSVWKELGEEFGGAVVIEHGAAHFSQPLRDLELLVAEVSDQFQRAAERAHEPVQDVLR
jgi:hypothetical protein